MPSPFPGMDPYLERPVLWPDFHNRLITFLSGALQPILRPRYAALAEDRLFVVESDRPVRPDLSIVETQPGARRGGATAVLEADAPAVFELWREEIRQPLITIIEPATGRIVTAIEVLSPDNKIAGEGRASYLRKRDEYWDAGVNLVEIDLLRAGEPTVRVSPDKLEQLRPWHYLVTVTRRFPSRQEVYAVPLRRRLPKVAIPLASDDQDVPLDLQAAFTRCWDEGPYPALLRYSEPPPVPLAAEDLAWSRETLANAGHVPPAAAP